MHGREVKISPHGRADLSEVRTQKHQWYLATEETDGTIILVPALLVPARLAQVPREDEELISR